MASAQPAASAGDNSVSDARLRKSPLWKHVKLVEKNGVTGGNARSQCLYCNHMIPGSYYRVRAHVLKEEGKGVGICTAATQEMVDMFRREEEAAKAATEANVARTVPMLVHLTVPPSGARASSKRKKQTGIAESFNLKTRQMADAIIARMFYTGGLPFHLARNPNSREAFNFIASHDLGGYVPPSIKKLRTTLLQQERANLDRLLEPIRSTWNHKGVTTAADGWTDAQRRPLINFIAITETGPMFLKCENTEGKTKTKKYIAELLSEIIEKVGSKNVVQVITDNAANCKGAGLIIEAKYDNIFWTPCVVHTLNLALKSICAPRNSENLELQRIGDVAGYAAQIKNFIMNHGMRLSIFNSFSKLKFLAVADTRFASVIVMLKRFLHLKDALERMVISDKWAAYKEDDQEKANFFECVSRILHDRYYTGQWLAEVPNHLVFVHNNLRLVSRNTAEYTSGPSHMWDVRGDGYDTFDGVGILQSADFSLDEPEFEQMITGDEEP
ncbi:hypothetical protein PR202_ga20403 [Eleusine coracana subsp. coracana]|uniref:DUF659 domain-containing protein n=1 Tax=Eleusine coracana subsp. coracana TaxID=191504 RepID=A0AAV5CY89_ELECO|nr:hypothetical protein PR202_ga20403 [Eleusine coracana subsp. coracana]